MKYCAILGLIVAGMASPATGAETPQASSPPAASEKTEQVRNEPPPPGTKLYTQAELPKLDPPSYYPDRASEDEVEGSVVLNCQIGEDRRLARCAIVEETPMGYGFGEMAARIMLNFARIQDTPDAVAGKWIRNTYQFRF